MKTKTKHLASITAGILSLAGYASAASLGSEKYTYDASGNIIEKSIDGKVTKMTYERSNRLTEIQTAGQSKEIISCDLAGRPTSEKEESGKQIRIMSYGYGDKVLEVQNHGIKAIFYYSADGQLVGKDTNETFSMYIWDGNALAAKGSEAFTNEAHVTGGVPVLAEGGEFAVVSDYLGTTLASGDMQCVGTAYGINLEEGRFTGKLFVKELGSFIFQYRSYSPSKNSWMTSDPSGFPDGTNNFTYASNDPLANFDALGLVSDSYRISLSGASSSTCNMNVDVNSVYLSVSMPTTGTVSSEVFPVGYSVLSGSESALWSALPTLTQGNNSKGNYTYVSQQQIDAKLTAYKVTIVNGVATSTSIDLSGNKTVDTSKAYEN